MMLVNPDPDGEIGEELAKYCLPIEFLQFGFSIRKQCIVEISIWAGKEFFYKGSIGCFFYLCCLVRYSPKKGNKNTLSHLDHLLNQDESSESYCTKAKGRGGAGIGEILKKHILHHCLKMSFSVYPFSPYSRRLDSFVEGYFSFFLVSNFQIF